MAAKPAQAVPRGVVAIDVNEHYVYYCYSQWVMKVEMSVEEETWERPAT